jgi:uncharacterized protein (TIGR03437 family)
MLKSTTATFLSRMRAVYAFSNMRTFKLLLFAGLAYAQFAGSGIAATCLPAPAGLVGWWPGDLNESDIANGNNASAVVNVSLVPGEVLDGFSFGTDGYISVPSSPALANQAFTWAAWVRSDGPSPTNDQYGSVILENVTSGTDVPVALSWRATDNRFLFIFGNIPAELVVSTDAFPPGTFYHVAGTYDGSVFRLFINGVLEGSLSEAKTVAYSPTGWTFGSIIPTILSKGMYIRTWNGVIDEIQAFNRPLSGSELQSIYNAGSAGECKGPAVTPHGVVSASAFGAFSSVAPGTWIEIYGTYLASDTCGWQSNDFDGNNAPTKLDGTSVSIGGKEAFVDYISPGQIDVLVSSDTLTGTEQLVVTTVQGNSTAYSVTVNPVEPGLLAPASFNVNNVQYVVALFSDGSYALPTGAIAGVTSRPAKPGDVLTMYGVGFGAVSPVMPAGELVQQLNTLADTFTLSIGGTVATVAYDGLAPGYTGLYQFNVTVPDIPSGNAALTFSLGGQGGTQKLTLAVMY